MKTKKKYLVEYLYKSLNVDMANIKAAMERYTVAKSFQSWNSQVERKQAGIGWSALTKEGKRLTEKFKLSYWLCLS